MAMRNPVGRANYEPNGWGKDGGPREDPKRGFTSYPEDIVGEKRRVRSETFADHYSQASQFYRSQTEVERKHIQDALTFELSKVNHAVIRERIVAHLLNISDELASAVADGLGMDTMPERAPAVREPITDLPVSDALSILKNGPSSFAGRKLGLYVSDGADAAIVADLRETFETEGATVAIVAAHIAGAKLSDGTMIEADEKIDGGPSVLFDAVAIVMSQEAGKACAKDKPSQDFASDAFAHAKFIAYTEHAIPLFEAAGIAKRLDEGCVDLSGKTASKSFLETCRKLRHWERTAAG